MEGNMTIFTKNHYLITLISLMYIFTFSSLSIAQSLNINKFQYLFPLPDSKLNSVETNIIIRFGDPLEDYGIEDNLLVSGNKNGNYNGKIILTENNKTLIYKPHNNFAEGEIITIKLEKGLRTTSNIRLPELQYKFETSKINLNKKIKSDSKLYLQILNPDLNKNTSLHKKNSQQMVYNQKKYTIQQDSLPADFPDLVVDTINDPTPGYIFFTPFGFPNLTPNYLIITDNYGIPVFYRKMMDATFDFKKINDSTLVYFDYGKIFQHYLLNSSYDIVDSLSLQNGYSTDLHEFIMLKDRHTFQLCYDYEQIKMDTIIEGGNPNATVIGIVLQEQDENKNVVFQWRSWDHYKITDATYDINLTDSVIDYAHSNAIEIDNDGNILLSTRHFDEITKIDRQTGEIIWRFGGKYCKNNQFTFLNDSIGFSHQHDVRRLSNGNISLFDNGNLHSPQFTRIAEYQVDEVNKIASLVWEYRDSSTTYSGAMGSARRLENHNTFIGWGYTNVLSMSEVRADKSITFSLTIPNTLLNYRAFKLPWKTNLFVTDPKDLFFEYTTPGNSIIKSLNIINNSNRQIAINGILNRDSAFTVITPIPITIEAFGQSTIEIKFKPEFEQNYSDELHLQWNSENQRIAQVVQLSGTSITAIGPDDLNNYDYALEQNYPNPFNPITTIKFSIPKQSKVKLNIFNLLGEEVKTLVNEDKLPGHYAVELEASNLPSGIYFYRLQAGNYVNVKKMILLK